MHKILLFKFQQIETTLKSILELNIFFQLWKRFYSTLTLYLFGELTSTMSPVEMNISVKWIWVRFTVYSIDSSHIVQMFTHSTGTWHMLTK